MIVKINSIYNHLCKYIITFIAVMCIFITSLNFTKIHADGSSLLYSNYSVKWVYTYESTGGTSPRNIYYIDMTISFNDYYSGTLQIVHTAYAPAYLCIGARVISNTTSAISLQFSNINEITLKFVFTGDEISDILENVYNNYNGLDYDEWLDGSIYTFTSSTPNITVATRPVDILNQLNDMEGDTEAIYTYLQGLGLTDQESLKSVIDAMEGDTEAMQESLSSILTTLGTVDSNNNTVLSYLSTLYANIANINAALTDNSVDNNILGYLEATVAAIGELNLNLSSDPTVNLNLGKLFEINNNTIVSNLYSKVLISQQYEIHDISGLTTTTLATNLAQSGSVTLSTRYKYYIINPGNYSYGNFDYIVLDTNRKTNYSNQFSYLKDDKIYTLYFTIASSVFTYSLEEYDPETNETNSVANSVVAYLYGTDDNPYALQVNTTVNVVGDFSFEGTVEVDTAEIESLLNDIITNQGDMEAYLERIRTLTGSTVNTLSRMSSDLLLLTNNTIIYESKVLDSQTISKYLTEALLSERYVIHNLNYIDKTLITTNLTQSASANVAGYRYLIIDTGNYSYSNQDYIVIDLNKKTNYSSQFYYLKDECVYILDYDITDSVFTYTLNEFNFNTPTEVNSIANSLVAYLYGTNDDPYHTYEEQIISVLDNMNTTLSHIDETLSEEIVSLLEDIDDKLDDYNYYDFDDVTWDEDFQSLPIDITGPMNVYKDIGTELYTDIMSTNFKYIVYAGYIMLMLGVFL